MFNLKPLLSEIREFKTILKDILRELIRIKSYLKRIEDKSE